MPRLCSKVKKVLEKQKEGYKLSTKAQSTTIPTCQNENINQCVTEITSPQRAWKEDVKSDTLRAKLSVMHLLWQITVIIEDTIIKWCCEQRYKDTEGSVYNEMISPKSS